MQEGEVGQFPQGSLGLTFMRPLHLHYIRLTCITADFYSSSICKLQYSFSHSILHQYRCINTCLQRPNLSWSTNMSSWHGTLKHWLWCNYVCFNHVYIKYMQDVSDIFKRQKIKIREWANEQEYKLVCVPVIPVSVVGNEHSFSDLAFNLLVNYQQHDSI